MSKREEDFKQASQSLEIQVISNPWTLFEKGCEYGYQYAVDKACEWLRNNMEYWLGDYNLAEDELEENQVHYAAMLEELRKAMQ